MNNLTNRPVRSHYEAFGFEGKQVGIIRIEERQARPLYFERNYGKLRKDEVYVRRGSSTDPWKPATPDEITLMGQPSGSQDAELAVEFADVGRDDSLGTHITWDTEFCEMPPMEMIPGLLPLVGRVFAENQPQPKDFSLMISVNVANTKMTLAELRSLPDPGEDDD